MVRTCHVAALLVVMTDAARLTSGVGEAYENFRRVHRNGAHEDDVSLADRRSHFEASLKEVEAHNARQPAATWKMSVNKFSDYTHEERRAMLGYRRSARVASYAGPTSSFLEIEDDKQNGKVNRSLAKAFDWGQQGLASSRFVKDQGRCGSCWAHAAAGAIEMRLEAQTGNASLISVDQMIDCTPNPRKCGGTGGCKGATAELGFEYAKTKGLALQPGYSSTSSHNKCNDAGTTSIVQVGGWIRLPQNKYEPLLAAVGKESPIAVSVDASKWFQYTSGVFGDCDKDAVINHAVLLVGYGTDKASGQDYWRIRNSWGSSYGEDGHIRVLRHDSSDAYCGIDHEPEKGVACEGDPATMPVCGMCGILSDSSYPESVSIK